MEKHSAFAVRCRRHKAWQLPWASTEIFPFKLRQGELSIQHMAKKLSRMHVKRFDNPRNTHVFMRRASAMGYGRSRRNSCADSRLMRASYHRTGRTGRDLKIE